MEPQGSVSLRRDSEPLSGAENMRIDEALLQQAVDSQTSTLRLYRWCEPTVSLGYFQRDSSGVPPGLKHLPRVSRLSGGGAILHDRELTYSVALSSGHPAARVAGELYERVHLAIIGVLERHGVRCRLRGQADSDPNNKSFLCFARADRNDIVVGATKIVGSAQRRRRGAVLQHGSILLAASALAPEHPGLLELGTELDPTRLGEELQAPLLSALESL